MAEDHIRTVPVQLPGGRTVLAEVAVAHGGDAGARSLLRLDDLGADISQIATFLAESVRVAMPDPPKRYSIEFGIKLAVDSSGLTSVLARVGAEATAVVRLEWE